MYLLLDYKQKIELSHTHNVPSTDVNNYFLTAINPNSFGQGLLEK